MTKGSLPLENSLQKTQELLKEIEEAFGWTKEQRNQSYAALRAVLHTLRDRLTVEEAVNFSDGLPLLLKGIFFDGWQVAKVPRKMDQEEFLQEIQQQFPFSIQGNIQKVISVVLQSLKKYINEGEIEDILDVLPKDIANMLKPMLT